MSDYQGNIIIKNPATPTGPVATGRAPGMWKLSDVAYWIKQGVWPDSNLQPDPYFPSVSLLLSTTSLSNANNNLFVDSSGAFSPVSRLGNTTQGSFTPYSTNWSNLFNASNIRAAYNSALDISSGDFTIEFWVNAPAQSAGGEAVRAVAYFDGSPSTGNNIGWNFVFRTNGSIMFEMVSGGTAIASITTATNACNNSWNHIAVSRSGNTFNLFLNGVSQGTSTSSATGNTNAAWGVYVGSVAATNTTNIVSSYISNVRIVKGTAVYTSNFTPPTSPLTAISGTSLLTCQSNRIRDVSSNAFTFTTSGTVSVQDFGPFSPTYPGLTTYNQNDITNWSGFFDGTGDYLSVANSSANNLGTGDFTIELWFRSNTGTMNTHACLVASYSSPTSGSWAFKAQSGNTGYIQFASYGPSWNDWVTTTNIAADRLWHHCAVTRSGNTLRIFVDGVVAGTWDISGASSFTGGGHPLTTGFMAQDSTSYLNGNVSNVRIVKGTALYTSAFTPPTSPLTAISGTVYLTCQNAAFTDNSTNNFVITQFGNPTVSGNTPFQPTGYWSLSGTTDQGATIPQTTATDLGSGSFTIECWVNAQAFNTFVTKRRTDTALTGSWMLSADTNGYFYFLGVGWGSTYAATTNPIPLNRWTHLAVSRSGTNLSMFVNGVRVYNVTDSYNYTCSTYTIIKLGGNSGGNYPSGSALSYGFTGSISNLRIVQGTAVYDPAATSFTVPTSPLTAISGTSLLTCQDRTMKDNSTNNNTSIALYAGAVIQPFDPFYTSTIGSNGGSMYFDGTGDYLTLPSSDLYRVDLNDWTMEAWVYVSSTGSNYTFLNRGVFLSTYSFYFGTSGSSLYYEAGTGGWATTATYTSSAGAIVPGQWNHVAAVRSGTSFFMYANGSRVLNQTSASFGANVNAPLWVGMYLNGSAAPMIGNMADVRFTQGTALYTGSTYTVPTAPLTPSANTTLLLNGMNGGIYDATTINDMETVGNAQVSTAVSKFGGSSVYFDGTGDRIAVSPSENLNLATGDFTVEGWFYSNSTSGNASAITRAAAGNISTGAELQWGIYRSGSSMFVRPYQSTTDFSINVGTIATGTWYHVAMTRSGNTIRGFLNGVLAGTTQTISGALNNSTAWYGALIGGITVSGSDEYWNGYIDEVRVTKGVARYTSNFTPPTQAFPTY